MLGGDRSKLVWSVLAVAAVAGILALSVQLRLEEPLSSTVLPAEDTYTHTALVRDHVEDGRLEPLNPDGSMYPPGMHAFVAAAWIYTGADLYELMRFGPVLFGAIGVLGIALLLWRSDGPAAAVVGALAAAVVPEIIFRTTMMAPTAVDLALMPFLFYALLELVRGRLVWAGVAAPVALFFVFAHPWALTIVGLASLAFGVFAVILGWPGTTGRPPEARGVAAAIGIVGVSWGLAVHGCWDLCGPGLRGIVPRGGRFTVLGPIMALVTLGVMALMLRRRERTDAFLSRASRRPMPVPVRAAVSLLLAVGLAAVTIVAFRAGFPEFVNPVRMFGIPVLALSALAFVLLPFVRSPAALTGAAIAASTLPFVVFNPLDSPFWPHRTAVYLGLALVILTGVAAGFLVRAAAHAFEEARRRTPQRTAWAASSRPAMAVLPAFLVLVFIGGSVYAATPETYEDGWYRLYTPCEHDGLRAVAEAASPEPAAVVITGDWQAKVVIAALTEDASRVWYKPDFYTSAEARDPFVAHMRNQSIPLYVVVDHHMRPELPEAETDFLRSDPWVPLGDWCGLNGNVTAHRGVVAYSLKVTAS